MGEYKRLIEKLKEMEDKYLKEQKRANLLEIENTRNIDELKKLKKKIMNFYQNYQKII